MPANIILIRVVYERHIQSFFTRIVMVEELIPVGELPWPKR